MRNRFISRAAVLIALGLICLTARPATGQVKNATAKSAVPRMPDGHPDLQGTYDLATLTPYLVAASCSMARVISAGVIAAPGSVC